MGLLGNLIAKLSGKNSSTAANLQAPDESIPPSPTVKICVKCGTTCDSQHIACPQCGFGIFDNPKSDISSARARVPKMAAGIAKSKDAFVSEAIKIGSSECLIPIRTVFEVLERLLKAMKSQGMTSEQVIAGKDKHLRCICPKCGYTLDGAALGTLHLLHAEGVDNVILTGRSDKAIRFLSGHCVNGDCDSQRVILRWQD